MTVFLLYNKATAAERSMAGLASRLEREQVRYELLDADTPRGIAVASDFDVLARPAIILTSANGSVQETWTEEDRFPSVAELAYRDRA